MKQFCILLAFCAVVGAAAGEFYRLDLNKLEPGTVLVQTDAAGRCVHSARPGACGRARRIRSARR
ncbi:MAG: hypothetical protein L6W00_18555 [Lentisphaeria bacterium]|nr:MAG: hypothetical protein L6W00_18555 [Lentisphaeria bacterium]